MSINHKRLNILLVDDEPLIRRSLSEVLTLEGYAVTTAGNGYEALELLKHTSADIIIADIKMPQMGGIELLRNIKSLKLNIPVVLVTGYGSIDSAVEAIKDGAYDYITKPIIDNEIKIVIERLAKEKRMLEENTRLKEQIFASGREKFLNMVGRDPKMQKIFSLIETISETRATVLIYGESGTGKRLIAHAVHNSDEEQRATPFIEVSCGALSETLLESEIFGHVKGAFTGAIKDKMGRFEMADGGTIFLDEIDCFSPLLQVKLLRVIQEGELERVGDTKTKKVNVRIIAATNQDLQKLIAEGKFRQDLYYRLNIINIDVPPLRERMSDIELLCQELIEAHAKNLGKKIKGISEEVKDRFMRYSWPGNVRELENILERAIILSKGPVITLEHLPDFLRNINNIKEKGGEKKDDNGNGNGNGGYKLKDALKDPERDIIVKVLESNGWNRKDAAHVLGINRTTLYKKMVKYNLLKNNGQN